MSDVLYSVGYGYHTSVCRVNRALKKKIFKGYFLEVIELDKDQKKAIMGLDNKLSCGPGRYIDGLPDPFTGKLIKRIRWLTAEPTAAHTDKALFRVELWGPGKV
jgi:hypothetical protein